jgi:cytochrome c553
MRRAAFRRAARATARWPGNAGAGFPALRAQHSVYTVKQLQDYLTSNRYRDSADATKVHTTRNSVMMTTIAARLTPEDIRNLASYLQGLR